MRSVTMTVVLFCVVLILCGSVVFATNRTDHRLLSRNKRYLTFPEGSTFSFAFCMELKTVTQDVDIFTEGVAANINYDLPNTADTLFQLNPIEPETKKKRRHRRDLYGKVETLLNSVGIDGRSCVLRTLCEAAQQLVPRIGMLEELLRVVFTMPTENMSADEPTEHHQYSTAYRSGVNSLNCVKMYPRCPLSLLTVLLEMKPTGLPIMQ